MSVIYLSPQELRVEDYLANRKGKQPGTAGFGFGGTQATATQQSTGFGFGQTNKPAGFGTSSKYSYWCSMFVFLKARHYL